MDFPRLVSGQELLSIFERFNTGEGGEDRVERVIREVSGNWKLERIPLKLISFSDSSVAAPTAQKRIKRYSQMKTPAPPVILDEFSHGETDYEIVDGFHRIAVANQRGDKDIMAYVPAGNTVEAVTAAGDPEKPLDKLNRVLPLVNRQMPPGLVLQPVPSTADEDDMPIVNLMTGSGDPAIPPVRAGAFTFFSTMSGIAWFIKLFGPVPFSPHSGMVYVTYRDDRSGVEEPAGLLNMVDPDEVWAARLVTILGAPAAPQVPVPPGLEPDPSIINMKPQPIEAPIWIDQATERYPSKPIIYPKLKLPDSLWPVGWQPGDRIQQTVEAKAKVYPDSIMPTERNDFSLDDAKRLAITRYEAKALRADSFQAFQLLLDAVLIEQELEEPYRKTVAGLLNRSRKAKGYEAL